jgi:nicotinamide riboside kinase
MESMMVCHRTVWLSDDAAVMWCKFYAMDVIAQFKDDADDDVMALHVVIVNIVSAVWVSDDVRAVVIINRVCSPQTCGTRLSEVVYV